MELFVLVPMILVLSGVAIVLALKEQPLPATASTAFVAVSPPATAPRKATSPLPAPRRAAGNLTPMPPSKTADEALPAEEPDAMDSTFSHTDVLLADALTEMIGLKAELYHLRNKIDNLNREVARLSGGPPRPTPPAVSKQPVPLRRAA
jgi:hypothetical protein